MIDECRLELSTILERVTDGFFAFNRQWEFTYLNQAGVELLNRKREELLGRSIWDEFPEAVGSIFYIEYHRAFVQQVPVTFEEFYPPLNTWFEVRAYPNADGLSVYFRDISDRKQLDASDPARVTKMLGNNSERYRAIFEEAPVGIAHTDIKGQILRINRHFSNIIGYNESELQKLNFRDITNPEDLKQEIVLQQQLLSGSIRNYSLEKRYICKNRQSVWVRLSVALIYDANGQPLETIKVVQDISDRKASEQAEIEKQSQLTAQIAQEQAAKLSQALKELASTQAQLIQTEKMSSMGQLVAGIAHELNNPVNFIYGNITPTSSYVSSLLNLISLYQEYYPNPVPEIHAYTEQIDIGFIQEDFPKVLSSIKIGANRICELVKSLRNFSRLDEAEMKTVNIHEGIDSTLLILQNRLKNKSHRSAIEVIKEFGIHTAVNCYVGQLNQVFLHILNNAIDAIEAHPVEKPQIHIRTLKIENRVRISITDNGTGMTEEVKQKMFDPFFTTKPVGSGMGLGMSVSYQIVVQKHGGTLECFSTPGQGTELVITIPISQP